MKKIWLALLFLLISGGLQAEISVSDSISLQLKMDKLLQLPRTAQALTLALEIDSLTQQLNLPEKEAEIKNWLTAYYWNTGAFEASLDVGQKIFAIGEQLNNQSIIVSAYYDFGSIYSEMNDFDQALFYLKKAEAIADSVGAAERLPGIYNGIGVVYLKQGIWDEALTHLLKCRALVENTGREKKLQLIDSNIGIALTQSGRAREAVKYFKDYLAFLKNEKDTLNFAGAYGNLAYAHQNFADFPTAFAYYDTSLYYSESLKQDEVSYITYLDISDAYLLKEDARNALVYYKKYHQLSQKVVGARTKSRIAELEVQFDTERKEKDLIASQKEVGELEQSNQIRTQRMGLIISALVAILAVLGMIFSKLKSDSKKKAIERKLIQVELKNKALEAQQLQTELDSKKADLTNFALDITRKNEFSNELVEQLEQLYKVAPQSIKAQLRDTITYALNHLQISEDLAVFQKNVDSINQEFYQKLEHRFGKLSTNEKYISGLIRLNLSNKDIAAIKGISANSAKMNRYRLRKKFSLDPQQDIVGFLQAI